MNLNEIALGTLGKWIDTFLTWQFSNWYIVVFMCFLEIIIIYSIWRLFRRSPPIAG